MACGNRWFCVVQLFILLLLPIGPAHCQTQSRLVVEIVDLVLHPHDSTGKVTVLVTNPLDTIAGIELKIVSLNNQVRFRPAIDTVGTAMSGWQLIVIDTSGGGVHIGALPNQLGHFETPPIMPSQASRALISFPFVLSPIGVDTARDLPIVVQFDLEDFGFASWQGQLIGVVRATVFDTICLRCIQPDSGGCLAYEQVTEPPCDSIGYQGHIITYLDTNLVKIYNGHVYAEDCCEGPRGNVNFDAGNVVDLGDLSLLISYLVAHGARPRCLLESDINGSGLIDLTDLSTIIGYLLAGVPLPACP